MSQFTRSATSAIVQDAVMTYAHTDQITVEVPAPPASLFDHLDDQTRLGGHMEKPSMMMMGGRMTYQFDTAKGRAVGAVIKMGGSFLGLRLAVEEVVTVRAPPQLKIWETRGVPRILIMGAYRMGFEVTAVGDTSHLRIFIEYDHPKTTIGKILGALFAPLYARWCIKRMADDAARTFMPSVSARPTRSVQ